MVPFDKANHYENPDSKQLIEMAFAMTMAEKLGLNEPKRKVMKEELKKEFLIQIILKRIEVMKLPIKLNELSAIIAVMALSDRAGASVILLIDCLDALESTEEPAEREITFKLLNEIYPHGFYNEEALIERIDALRMGENKNKWDFSVTTGKYRNIFLGESKKETEKKIKDGIYILADLND